MVKNMLQKRSEKVAALIHEYQALKFERIDSVENMSDLVFSLYDKTDYKENLSAYPAALASLHKLLHQPEVIAVIRQVMLSGERKTLIRFLYRLHEFLDDLRDEQYSVQLEEKFVAIHNGGDSMQRLLEIEADYRARIQAHLSKNGTSA